MKAQHINTAPPDIINQPNISIESHPPLQKNPLERKRLFIAHDGKYQISYFTTGPASRGELRIDIEKLLATSFLRQLTEMNCQILIHTNQ